MGGGTTSSSLNNTSSVVTTNSNSFQKNSTSLSSSELNSNSSNKALKLNSSFAVISISGLDADSGTIVNDKTHAVESHTDTLDKWNTTYHVNYKWSLPDSVQINNGDTATFTLPSNVEVNADETCNLIDNNGNIAGTAVIKAGQHTGTITFNNDLSGKTNRTGTLSVGVTGTKNNSSSDSNTQNPNSGTTTPTKPTPLGQYVGSINKVGWYDKNNSNLINWDIVANLHNGQLYNPVITDNLGPGMEIVPGSIKVQEGYYVNGQFTGAIDVSSAQVSQQGNKIIVKVPSTDLAISVSYQVKIVNDNEQNYSNSAEISADNITTAKKSVAALPGHLKGNVNFGNNGSVTIEKYGKNNELLAGAKFVLINPGHEIVGELSTDKNGLAVFNGLKPGTYYVKEVQAPKGYAIDSALHEVQVTDGGNVKLNVVDAPINRSSSNSSSSSSSISTSSSLNSNSSSKNSSSVSSISSITSTSSSSTIYNFSSKSTHGLEVTSGKLNVNRNNNERGELPNTGENDNLVYELLGFLLLINLVFFIKKNKE